MIFPNTCGLFITFYNNYFRAIMPSTISSKNQISENLSSSPERSVSSGSGLDVSVLSDSFTSVIKSLCERHMTSIVVGFIEKLSQKGHDKEELLSVWNSVAPEYVIELEASTKKKQPTIVSGKICCFHFVRSNKDCDREVSVKSTTGKYCSRHLKEESKTPEDSPSPSAGSPKSKCEYEFKHGSKEGERCTSNVSDKSSTGKFCSKHAKTQEREKSPKKEKSKSKSKSNSKAEKKEEEHNAPVFAPRLNKFLHIYVDSESGFIFEKSADKKIYGKLVDGIITPLSNADKDHLTKMNYLFDEEILYKLHPDIKKKDESNEEEEDTEEEDDEGEVSA